MKDNKPQPESIKTDIVYHVLKESNFLTLSDYAKIKGISIKTAYNWYKAGKIKEQIIYKGKQPLIKII